jgi:histidyl-tRNA synthetase
MTPSLARLLLKSGRSLSYPLKWYSVDQCWRLESTTIGRNREHYQWNMDILGIPSITAEAELLASMVAFFEKVGLTSKDVKIHINSRPIINDLLKVWSIPESKVDKFYNIIDKLHKLTDKELLIELEEAELSIELINKLKALESLDDLTQILGDSSITELSKNKCLINELKDGDKLEELKNGDKLGELNDGDKLEELKDGDKLAELKDGDKLEELKNGDKLEELKDGDKLEELKNGDKLGELKNGDKLGELKNNNFSNEQKLKNMDESKMIMNSNSINELKMLWELAYAYGYDDWLKFDITVVRGLSYYTGIVFEAFDTKGMFRAIAGGGRYDKLLSTYGGNDVPAVGFGLGDAVIIELLKENELLPIFKTVIDDVILISNKEYRLEASKLATILRKKGRGVDICLFDKPLKAGFSFADKTGAQRILLVNEEIKNGNVIVKLSRDENGDNLWKGRDDKQGSKQSLVPISEL